VQAFSKDELMALLAAAKASSERDWLMILLTFWHGLRASEVIQIQAHHVRDGHLTVARLKGSLKTVQPLIEHPDPLLNEKAALIDYVSGRPKNQCLFRMSRTHFWRLVAKHARTAKLPERKGHPHALKHSCAMSLISKVGIENTRQWLGHRSMSSTGEYLKVSDEDAGRAVLASLKD